MNEVAIKPEIERGIQEVETAAKGIVVGSNEERIYAMEFLRRIKSQKAAIVNFFSEPKQKAHDAWKSIVSREKFFTNRIDRAEQIIKKEITLFDDEQERIRRERQAKLQAEADEKARKERERLEKRAAGLKTLEKKEEALRAAEEVVAPVVHVEPEIEKTEGEARQTVWKARIVDVDKIPREYMIPNEKAINAVARSTKGQIAIPGVEIYSENILKVRV